MNIQQIEAKIQEAQRLQEKARVDGDSRQMVALINQIGSLAYQLREAKKVARKS